jgi:hypothetical protein
MYGFVCPPPIELIDCPLDCHLDPIKVRASSMGPCPPASDAESRH